MKNKNLITTFSTKYNQNRNFCPFWATVCKTVRPMLSDRCPVCLSVCPVCPVCPVCNVGALWPNGWTDQDENWQASALATLCKMGTQLPPKKEAEPPIFGPYLLWPNGWMDQDGIWHGGRPRLRRHCVRWDLAAPKRGTAPPIFGPCVLWPNGSMDQDATWYGGRPRPRRHCVRWSPTPPRGTAPNFRPTSIVVNGRPSQLVLSSCLHSDNYLNRH